jgi:RHS repeat-associated protein
VTSYTYDNLNRVTRETKQGAFIDEQTPGPSRTIYHFYDGLSTTTLEPSSATLDLGQLLAQNVVTLDQSGRIAATIDVVQAGTNTGTTFTYGAFGTVHAAYAGPVGGGGTTVVSDYNQLGAKVSEIDPDRGTTQYHYNGFGELSDTRDAKGEEHRYFRDVLGRIVSESSSEGQTWNIWDSATNGLGKLAATFSADSVSSVAYAYNSLGQKISEQWIVGSATPFTVGYSYDGVGRLGHISYPAVGGVQLGVDQTYDPLTGVLSGLKDSASGTIYWQLSNLDAAGRMTDELLGGVLERTTTYDPLTRGIANLVARHGTTKLEDLTIQYDKNENVTSRLETVTGISETFQYDALKRLRQWTSVNGSYQVNWDYDPLGNLKSRVLTRSNGTQDQATFGYGERGAGPHALTSAPWGAYSYDLRGDQYSGPNRAAAYGDYHLPLSMSTQSGTTTFAYDGFHRRVMKSGPDGTTKYIAGLYERRDLPNGSVAHVLHIGNGQQLVAEVSTTGDDTAALARRTTTYLVGDQLQSVGIIANANGDIITRLRYDPFGGRIVATDAPDAAAPPQSVVTLGFAGAEEDDSLGVINLNGRLYDPRLGRFLSPDPLVGGTAGSQAYNRYSYVWNRPLNFRDPSGFDGEGATDVTSGSVPQEVDPEEPGELDGTGGGGVATSGNVDTDSGGAPTATTETVLGVGGIDARAVPSGDGVATGQATDSEDPGSRLRVDGETPLEAALTRQLLAEARPGLGGGATVPFVSGVLDLLAALPWAMLPKGVKVSPLDFPMNPLAMPVAMAVEATEGLASRLVAWLGRQLSKIGLESAGAEGVSAAERAANPVEGLRRVGSALKTDSYHALPDIVDNYASGATKTQLSSGADLYQILGSLNGVEGRFEWIVDGGNVTHRYFVNGGTLNGIPIKP